jgi:hypothetical protein
LAVQRSVLKDLAGRCFVQELRVVDNFQLMTIIAQAISTCGLENRSGGTVLITSEQAACIAKVVVAALSQAGLEITPISKAAGPT